LIQDERYLDVGAVPTTSTIRAFTMAKFESKEEYNQWCEDIISKIYYSNIAMNNEGIKEAVMEIASKLHIPEGECLYDGGEIGSTGVCSGE
jgi:hypothetical protein